MSYSYRRKQMLNWARVTLRTNPIRIEEEFHYQRWMDKVYPEGSDIVECIQHASEEELDDLYILREELRLGI